MFLPSAIGSLALLSSYTFDERISLNATISLLLLGSSMPMTFLPDTTATRAEIALIERAMSSARFMTRDDFVPGAGSSSYKVTTGPGRTLVISPLTPKSSRTDSSIRAFCSRASWVSLSWSLKGFGVDKRLNDGKANSPSVIISSIGCRSIFSLLLTLTPFLSGSMMRIALFGFCPVFVIEGSWRAAPLFFLTSTSSSVFLLPERLNRFII